MSVVKLVLCTGIVISGALIGLHYSVKLTSRLDILQEFSVLFNMAAAKIEYSSGDLCEVFSDNFAGYEFIRGAAFYEQWECFVDSFKDNLSEHDSAVLKEFGSKLGLGDTDNQINHIRLYSKLTEECIAQAREDISSKAKLYRTIPVSVGVVISILII